MIKVIKTGSVDAMVKKVFRITCKRCDGVFECDEEDFYYIPASYHGMVEAIDCPMCHEMCYNWQGGSKGWKKVEG